jgi:hypothetical protein
VTARVTVKQSISQCVCALCFASPSIGEARAYQVQTGQQRVILMQVRLPTLTSRLLLCATGVSDRAHSCVAHRGTRECHHDDAQPHKLQPTLPSVDLFSSE